MSVISKSVKDEQTRLFIFSGRESVFPLNIGSNETFYAPDIVAKNPDARLRSTDEATRLGYFVVASLLRRRTVASVTAFVSRDGEDTVAVTLRDNFTWNSVMKQPAAINASQTLTAKTLEIFITDILNKDFPDIKDFDKDSRESSPVLYQDPNMADDAKTVVEKVNQFFDKSKKSNDKTLSIFQTLKTDKGDVRALSFNPSKLQLTVEFSGSCSTGCTKGDTSITESALQAIILRNFHQINSCHFVG